MFLYITGHINGVNAIGGHELIHRKETIHKIFGAWSYLKMLYGHFSIEHLRGHHINVSTHSDPATSRENESLYWFILRSAYTGHRDTWKRECERLQRRGKSYLSLENRMISFTLIHAGMLGVTCYVFGIRALWFHLAYSAVAIFYGESVNYVEHYGLKRK